MDLLGQQLDNYELVRYIGHGGYADIYCGKHHRLQSLVAIKVLKSTEISAKSEENFLKEARVLTRLIHPHIIHVIDCGIWQEPDDLRRRIPYIVMTYAPLGNLRSTYPEGTRLPLDKIALYVRQMASALQFAHDQKNNGIVHCDVKPENMLLMTLDDLRLSDFGIAKDHHNTMEIPNLQDARQGSLKIFGTPGYMPPEQCLRGQVSRAGDQYSLAVVVYEWLTGFRPFDGDNLAVLRKHAYEDPPAMGTRFPGLNISQEIEHVVMKALAKDIGQRYSRIEDFARALEEAIAVQQAQPGSPTIEDTPLPKRQPPAARVVMPAAPAAAAKVEAPEAKVVVPVAPAAAVKVEAPAAPQPPPVVVPAPAPLPQVVSNPSPSAAGSAASAPSAPAASVPSGGGAPPAARVRSQPRGGSGGSQQGSVFAGGRPATGKWSPAATTLGNQPLSQSSQKQNSTTGFEDFRALWTFRPFHALGSLLNDIEWLKRYPRSEFIQRPKTLFPFINQSLIVLLTLLLLFTAFPSSLAFAIAGFVAFRILAWARDLSHARAANVFLGLVSLYYGIGAGILCNEIGFSFVGALSRQALLLLLPILVLGLSIYWNYNHVRLMHRQ